MFRKVVADQLIPLLSPSLRDLLSGVEPILWNRVEEIRLRERRPLALNWSGGEALLERNGRMLHSHEVEKAYIVSRGDMEKTLQLISKCSLYAFEEELRRGYLTVPGGHRIGLCGQAVMERGRIKFLHHIGSLNFRIARQIKGVGVKVIPFLMDRVSADATAWEGGETRGQGEADGRIAIHHTLIISPPQGGKTTLLRDLARCLSSGLPEKGLTGFKIGLVDERSEIAGCYEGVPQMDVGARTDVLDCAPKAEGMMLLLRSMSPEIIITDEIGREEDVEAIEEVINAGITVITSAHAAHPGELSRRPSLHRMLGQGVFRRIVVLGRSRGVGTVEEIVDPVTDRVVFRQ